VAEKQNYSLAENCQATQSFFAVANSLYIAKRNFAAKIIFFKFLESQDKKCNF